MSKARELIEFDVLAELMSEYDALFEEAWLIRVERDSLREQVSKLERLLMERSKDRYAALKALDEMQKRQEVDDERV